MPATIVSVLGTRPEVIKLAPVIRELEARGGRFRTRTLASGQHQSLFHDAAGALRVRIDRDLSEGWPRPEDLMAPERRAAALAALLEDERPDLVLVVGDTDTALAGATAAATLGLGIGHIEAGLRTGDLTSPFPEEANRVFIRRLATVHFAPTERNRRTLLAEGVRPEHVAVTGNPGVDSLVDTLAHARPSPVCERILRDTAQMQRIVFTTHRRESFGDRLRESLKAIRRFVEHHDEFVVIFPLHPNPNVTAPAAELLSGVPRVRLVPPLPYPDFLVLLSHARLVISDSGGIQEEVPTLGKPLLVIRRNTERPEALECGLARLVDRPDRLGPEIAAALSEDGWGARVRPVDNPFGRGDAGPRIVDFIEQSLTTHGASDGAPAWAPAHAC